MSRWYIKEYRVSFKYRKVPDVKSRLQFLLCKRERESNDEERDAPKEIFTRVLSEATFS